LRRQLPPSPSPWRLHGRAAFRRAKRATFRRIGAFGRHKPYHTQAAAGWTGGISRRFSPCRRISSRCATASAKQWHTGSKEDWLVSPRGSPAGGIRRGIEMPSGLGRLGRRVLIFARADCGNVIPDTWVGIRIVSYGPLLLDGGRAGVIQAGWRRMRAAGQRAENQQSRCQPAPSSHGHSSLPIVRATATLSPLGAAIVLAAYNWGKRNPDFASVDLASSVSQHRLDYPSYHREPRIVKGTVPFSLIRKLGQSPKTGQRVEDAAA
jgi:hypothetical protein